MAEAELGELKDRWRAFLTSGDLDRPFVVWDSPNQTAMGGEARPIRIEVFVAPSFVTQYRRKARQLRRDPMQIFKALRNTRRGFLFEDRSAAGGRDGIFSVDLDRFDTDLTRELRRVLADRAGLAAVQARFPWLAERHEIVRVVAHPNGVRIRPAGFLRAVERDARIEQTLVLAVLGVDPK